MAGFLISAHRRFTAVFMRGHLAAAMLGLGVLISGCSGASTDADSTPAATSAPATPTSAAATPATGVQDATLGGTQVAFGAFYGSAGDGAPGHFKGNVSGTPVFIVALFSPNGHAHHLRLIPQESGVKWSAATGSGVAAAFLPKDAKHNKDATVSGSGLEHLYLSAALASTFSADQFYDINTGAAVTPGAFYFVCGGEALNDTDNGGCEFELGQ